VCQERAEGEDRGGGLPEPRSAEDLNWSEDSDLMPFLRKKCGGGR
jgi:hypothetical protein